MSGRSRLYDDWKWHYGRAEDLLEKSNTVDMADGWAQLVAAQAQVHATLATCMRADSIQDPQYIEVEEDEEEVDRQVVEDEWQAHLDHVTGETQLPAPDQE